MPVHPRGTQQKADNDIFMAEQSKEQHEILFSSKHLRIHLVWYSIIHYFLTWGGVSDEVFSLSVCWLSDYQDFCLVTVIHNSLIKVSRIQKLRLTTTWLEYCQYFPIIKFDVWWKRLHKKELYLRLYQCSIFLI